MLDNGGCASRADLARQIGVTRARVTQVLGLLDLAPQVLEAIVGLGDPLSEPVVSERSLRPLLNLPAEEQGRAFAGLAPLQRDRRGTLSAIRKGAEQIPGTIPAASRATSWSPSFTATASPPPSGGFPKTCAAPDAGFGSVH